MSPPKTETTGPVKDANAKTEDSKNSRRPTARCRVSGELKRRAPDYHILEASDGESGLALCRSQRIDCVVLAVELPDCSGFNVLVDLVPIV